ncbi:hypothetical protein [Hydrogenophaga sp. OTU3427]|uniref:hypothetical protein n=1 Tax=Hydrogenophaga sp. OTU3427 TaxID=3043856 RepID=UPI00313B97F1
MNRCHGRRHGALMLAIASLATAFVPSHAQAQGRVFPDSALRGHLVVTNPPDVLLNGQPARLSPGSRIRGTSNTLVFPQSLQQQSLVVNYTREATGLVHDVWILTAYEAAQPRAGWDGVIRNYRFQSEQDAAKSSGR